MGGEPVRKDGPTALEAAAATVTDLAREVAGTPEADRPHGYRHLLRAQVHDVVMRSTVDELEAGPQDLLELAMAVRKEIPEGAETGLNPRVEVFVRLLRADAVEAAWVLANDNASGVLQPSRPQATWAGGSNLITQLALPTHVDGDRVFAWLPGFRDPRWAVPDDVYDITRRVVLRSRLDLAVLRDGKLQLSGVGYLGQLTAAPDDAVTIELRGPDGARIETAATRTRRPELVRRKGPELTRLAWGGWSARVDLTRLAGRPGLWRAHLHVVQQGVARQVPLGKHRGPLVPAGSPDELHTWRGVSYRLTANDSTAALAVRATPIAPRSRRLVRKARRIVRQQAGREVGRR